MRRPTTAPHAARGRGNASPPTKKERLCGRQAPHPATLLQAAEMLRNDREQRGTHGICMSFLQRIGIGKGRSQEVKLERELTRLQMALASCKEVATFWQRRGRG